MNEVVQSQLDEEILAHQAKNFSPQEMLSLCQQFRKHGFIKVPEIVSRELRDAVKQEALRLLDEFAERRDLKLSTTDYTPRKMSVVGSEIIAENSLLINLIYKSEPIAKFLVAITREPLYPCPSKDEEFLITRHEKKDDTHGWHWGDFSFALIWLLETPPTEYGGMLQCIPHTDWDKSNPKIHEYLCANQITTYPFSLGDIYFLRTDTTLHRTIPLNRDATRIILNMTWASAKDLSRKLLEDDRWWAETNVEAAIR
ncbi:MAG: hypothetical protein WCF57_07135 [Pyrinomonadaceae bacterium]